MDKIIHQKLFGFNFISDTNHQLTIEHIMSTENHGIESNTHPFLITPNVDQIVKFSEIKHKELKEFYAKSAYVFPDGQPIVWSSKILGRPLLSRLTGSDFFPKIWDRIKVENKKSLLIVPSEEIAKVLEKEHANCKCYVPPFFKVDETKYSKIKDDILDLIESFQPDFLFIGLGFPKQETLAKDLYMQRLNNNLQMPLTFLLGASFEFYIGAVNRAPLWMQKIGMEWFYRFVQEPKRMFKRYFIDDMKFISLVFKEIQKNPKFKQ